MRDLSDLEGSARDESREERKGGRLLDGGAASATMLLVI
jgi:hypothetical protein